MDIYMINIWPAATLRVWILIDSKNGYSSGKYGMVFQNNFRAIKSNTVPFAMGETIQQ